MNKHVLYFVSTNSYRWCRPTRTVYIQLILFIYDVCLPSELENSFKTKMNCRLNGYDFIEMTARQTTQNCAFTIPSSCVLSIKSSYLNTRLFVRFDLLVIDPSYRGLQQRFLARKNLLDVCALCTRTHAVIVQ